MATLSQADFEANYLKTKLQSLSKIWDGKNCILQMKNNNSSHWRQMVNCCQFRSTTEESFSIVNHCSKLG